MNAPERMPTTGCGEETAAASAAAGSLILDWPAILAAHERWLRRVVTARVQERQAVDEVMQEVALAAVAQRSPPLNPGRLVGWLYRLAVRQALIYRRKAGRQRALVDRYARQQATGGEDTSLSPLSWLMHDERRGPEEVPTAQPLRPGSIAGLPLDRLPTVREVARLRIVRDQVELVNLVQKNREKPVAVQIVREGSRQTIEVTHPNGGRTSTLPQPESSSLAFTTS